MSENSTLIALCIPTFRRPVLLKQCLLACSQLNLPDASDVIIIVVDNDSEHGSQADCEEFSSRQKMTLHYYVEAGRGLCSVRNCLIEKALQHQADLIAFLDDDEMPHKDWLANLCSAMHKHAVDIVTGPVIATREDFPPMQFDLKHKYESGDTPRYVSSNNVMFKEKLVAESKLRFDSYYNFMGGEDFDFFGRASDLGFTSVWINEAIVFEIILPERETLKYIFYRHYSGGINNVLRYKKSHSPFSTWVHFIPKILGKFIGSLVRLFCAIFNKHAKNLEKAAIKIASGLGYIAGLLNIIHERYRYS